MNESYKCRKIGLQTANGMGTRSGLFLYQQVAPSINLLIKQKFSLNKYLMTKKLKFILPHE